MPTYAYQCESCGNEFDLRQSFNASTEQACPACSGHSRRRISVPAVIYKGSGFYTTDYASKGSDSSSGASSSPSSSSSSSPSSSAASASSEESSTKTADSKSKASSATE